jgi:hypothetical protein
MDTGCGPMAGIAGEPTMKVRCERMLSTSPDTRTRSM